MTRPEAGPAERAGVLDGDPGQLEHRGGVAVDDGGARRTRPEAGDGVEERPRVLVAGAGEQLDGGRLLDDPAVAHHDDAVGDVGDDAHVVGDDEDAHAGALLQLAHEVEDLGLHRDVERRGRLVGDEQLGLRGHRHGDHRPLPLPAGELVGVVADLHLGVGHVHLAQQLDGPLPGGGLVDVAVAADGLHQVVADRVDGVERRHGLLEDHGHVVAAHLPHPPLRRAHQLLAGEPDRAGTAGALRQQVEHRHGGHRLAGAGLADERDRLAGGDGEADAVGDGREPLRAAELDADVGDLEQRGGRRGLLEHGLGHRWFLDFGSSPERSASPTRPKARMVSTTKAPGTSRTWGSLDR